MKPGGKKKKKKDSVFHIAFHGVSSIHTHIQETNKQTIIAKKKVITSKSKFEIKGDDGKQRTVTLCNENIENKNAEKRREKQSTHPVHPVIYYP